MIVYVATLCVTSAIGCICQQPYLKHYRCVDCGWQAERPDMYTNQWVDPSEVVQEQFECLECLQGRGTIHALLGSGALLQTQ